MDLELLKKISKAFIYPNKRERFLLDIVRRSKDANRGYTRGRADPVFRLPEIIDQSLMLMKSMHFPPPEELISLMQQNGVGDTCFVLSEYTDLLGVVVPLVDAVNRLHINGFPSLIVGLPSGFTHLKYDSFASHQPNCFVKPRIRFDGET